jgi:ribose/xylose/arabinose/galactoside ABC-type transport system permease subunit/ABC-type sugar transport system substrate-binding protein
MTDRASAGNGVSRAAMLMLRQGRLLLLGIVVFAAMTWLAPGQFPTGENLANILRATSTDALAAAGFTVVMLTGQLDLSIGMTMTTGGVVVMLLQPVLGWTGAFLAAAMAGLLVGLLNGTLVSRARINSFIVTLGTMTILQGLNRALLQGGSKSLDDIVQGRRAVEWLQSVQPWSPRVLLIFVPIIVLELLLRRTRQGRNLFLIGGNPQTAWYAGVRTGSYVLAAFVLSGVLAALGGAFTAISQNTAMPNLGDKSLMLIVAATIVGGTAMSGGRGSVLMSIVALVILNALTNGLGYIGASKSVNLIANGAVLAVIITLDAWRAVRRERARGQRRELLREWETLRQTHEAAILEDDAEESQEMKTSDRTFATVCVVSVACVAIVAIFALATRHDRMPVTSPSAAPAAMTAPAGGDEAAKAKEVLAMKSTDNQPLIWIDDQPLNAPPRPADPTKLADDDLLRWWDSEYAGWTVKKLPMPKSPGTGIRGKKLVSLQYMDHPYWKGYSNGAKRVAEAYGVNLTILEAGNDNKLQAAQVEQVIRLKPDMVILTPVDTKGVVPMLKRLYDEKIPCIASNLLPVDEGMQYVITWTGPDDWGQFRMLAREFAKKMNYEGNYCVVRHIAGTSCYLSRTWAAVSELKKIAPKMTYLDMQSTDLKTEETKTQVAAWLKKYGADLKGIVSADDSKAQVGIAEALKDAGRTDVVCVAAGSSRTGLEYIKAGSLHAITFQSAEADGALPIEIAARWFRGEKIERPVYYLQKHIITAADVDKFLPAQW